MPQMGVDSGLQEGKAVMRYDAGNSSFKKQRRLREMKIDEIGGCDLFKFVEFWARKDVALQSIRCSS